MESMVSMLTRFMAVDSTTGKEGEFANLVQNELEASGWFITKQVLPTDASRFNLLATRSHTAVPRLIFNCHFDTVPPFIAPTEDEHNIYGRGANEAKGAMVCQICAANVVVETRPEIADQVGILFVVGEEIDHIGMTVANSLPNVNPEYLIVGEPTELNFATIQKGALKVLLKSKGVAGHSGYLSSGESAIHKLIPVLNDILAYEWPNDPRTGATTVNIGLIEGGQAQNAWASEAKANVFVRVTTSVDDILTRLKSIVNDRIEVEILGRNEPVTLSTVPLDDVQTYQAAFNTDMPYYHRIDSLKGKFLFGAGSITNAHSKDEFMPKSELVPCRDALVRLVTKLLA